MSTEQIVLLVLAVNGAICAAVPADVKAKLPKLWAFLDAVALNVGHAANGTDKSKPWQAGVAAAVLGAALSIAAAPSKPVEPRNEAQPMLVTSAAVPAVVEPAAVSPATAATDATAGAL